MAHSMELGAFSVSLAVKDIEASRDFYAKFGLAVMAAEGTDLGIRIKLWTLQCPNHRKLRR